jgi:alpha-maltose-1-phosphate synthase
VILQSHPMGNVFVRELACGLAEAGLLSEFWTGLDYPEREGWLGWVPESLKREARRRRLPTAVKPFARLRPWGELGRLLAPRLGAGGLIRHETGRFSVDRIFADFDAALARRVAGARNLRGVYLYEDGAAATFAAARARGVRTFYDLPIGYWRAARRILGEEAELRPEWAATLEGNFDSAAKLARKDRELELADTVFVASSFTRRTLEESPARPRDVVLAPYGAPPAPAALRPAARRAGEPLRALFVGSLGQRKGVAYLLEAMGRLGAGFELTLIGTVPGGRCEPLAAGLRRHRHVASLPHHEILAEMRRHHVLVFPSLFEGFGLVLLEAMANGLPVIATAHTAAPDIMTDGREGFVVPIRSAEVIAEKLELLQGDEALRQGMGEAALARARCLTWTAYRAALVDAIRSRVAAG